LRTPARFDQLKVGDVIILYPTGPRQAIHAHRESTRTHVDAGVELLKIRFVIIKRASDHIKAETSPRRAVKGCRHESATC